MPDPNCRICGNGSGICSACEDVIRKAQKQNPRLKPPPKKDDGKKK